ncbi:MAG: SDR family NAD(P)-dependent oxidoreductase, partial [Cytophagaceae bacterium]
MNTDEGDTDNTDEPLSDDGGVLFITEDILVTADFPSLGTSSGRNSNGKTALITGASSGIGRELANLFAKDGYDLVLVARSEDSLLEIADEYEQQFGIQATVISRDLTDPSAPDEIYAETLLQGIKIDVLVNNAGIGEYG